MDERDALLQLLVGVDDRRLGNADRRFLGQRLHDQGERQAFVPADRTPDAAHFRLGDADAMVREQLLRQRLVAREQQPARIAARVGQLQQLEMRDDVLIEDRDVVEALEQIEGDVRLPFGRQAPDLAEVVVDAQRLDLMTHRRQRGDDVVLGPPRRRCDVGAFRDLGRRNQMAMDERDDPHLGDAHSATRCRPLCR